MTIASNVADISITAPAVVLSVLALTVTVLGVLVVWPGRSGITARITALACGMAAGVAVTSWLSDGSDVLEVPVPWPSRLWIGSMVGGLSVALVTVLQRTRWLIRLFAMTSVGVVVMAAALGVNADFGVFQTTGSLFSSNRIGPGSGPLPSVRAQAGERVDVRGWRPPPEMPRSGELREVEIPVKHSGFTARPAVLWLPPAARVGSPPVLPVMLAFSGKPGSPGDLFTIGGLAGQLEAQARAHDGLAPIVLGVDHLGSTTANPMCVDSPLGEVSTYILKDVVSWVLGNFRVPTDRSGWGVLGFSTGGTCALQMLAGHPERFQVGLVIGAEARPRNGSDAETVRWGFGGDDRAWHAQWPANLFASRAPFPADTFLEQYWGSADPKAEAAARVSDDAARAAGVIAVGTPLPGGHDWNVVRSAIRAGLPVARGSLGLGAP